MKKFISIILSFVLIFTVIPTVNAEAATAKSWKKLYAEYLNSINSTDIEYLSGKLIYVNDDNIPELFLASSATYLGDRLLTVYKGKLYEHSMGWYGNFKYLKKKNRVYFGWGHMGYYGDGVAKLSKGKLVTLGQGTVEAVDEYGDFEVDENFDKIGYFRYYWNNKEVTKISYNKKLHKAMGKKWKKYTTPKTVSISKIKDSLR